MKDHSFSGFAYGRDTTSAPQRPQKAAPGTLRNHGRGDFRSDHSDFAAEGIHRLTTTRVAERAGVSVGTMYQYFPHKQALLYALNERYLDLVAERVEAACQAQHGASAEAMIEALVTAYWHAKTERSEVTRALYRSAVELDNEALIDAFARRMDAATTAMLKSAPDAVYANIDLVNVTLLSVIFGTVRNVFERNLPVSEQVAIRQQLMIMCLSYLEISEG